MLLLIEHGDRVIISEPTFMVYQLLVRGHGGEAVNVPLDRDFQLDAQGILDAVDDRTKLIMICNPNNPTGNLLAPEAIERIVANCTLPGRDRRGVRRIRRRQLPRPDGRVPESGRSAHVEQVRRTGRYACRLRHFPRVADAVPDARHAGVLQRQRGCQRRRHRRPRGRRLQPSHHRPHRRRSGDACAIDCVRSRGWSRYPRPRTSCSFGFRSRMRRPVVRELANRGVYVRHFGNPAFGIADCLRVSIGTPEDNAIFADELEAILATEEPAA